MFPNPIKYLTCFLATALLLSCTKQEVPDTTTGTANKTGEWLVPFDDILYWGDPPDEIVSIDSPTFEGVNESGWDPQDRVFIVQHEGVIRVYPVIIMEAHEIVNDRIGDFFFSVTYCPITGSGLAWNRSVGGEVTEFGVSGMLFRENLIPYDRNTGSYWSQMRMVSIHGARIGTNAGPVSLFETNYALVSTFFPEAEILSDSCSGLIGCRYKDTADDVEPGNSNTGLLTPGKFYFGLVRDDRAQVFSMDLFDGETKVFNVSFSGKKILLVGNKELNVVTAFAITGNGQRTFHALQDQFPHVFSDESGNVYNVFGVVESGPEKGEKLMPAAAYRAKGFAWETLFSRVELYEDQ